MRVTEIAIAATLAVGLSGPAMAQSSTSSQGGHLESHWTFSGYVGTNFNAKSDRTDSGVDSKASLNVGGQLGYLWHGFLGGEFLGDVSPTVKVFNANLADDPSVYTFVGNVIAAAPLGPDGNFQPYFSGGWGRIEMSTNVFNGTVGQAVAQATAITASRESAHATDFGGGLMAYAGKVGIRADVRHYSASSTVNIASTARADVVTADLLEGFGFWRTSVGVAMRW